MRGRFRHFLAAGIVFAGSTAAPVRAALVINEVLYDPVGPDDGREFVEIANTGPFAAPLGGVVLESGNGGKPDDWKEVWRGDPDAWIPPDGLYRVGLEGPGIGEPARLELQNGPDGVRLLKQGFELDRLGWGEHAHAEYFEGRAAPLTQSGRSLARRSDGHDTEDNAADFEQAEPTPGRPNHPAVDWAVRFGASDPELPRPSESMVIRLSIVNHGVETTSPPAVEVSDPRRTIRVEWDQPLAPLGSQTQAIVLDAPPDTGRAVWCLRLIGSDQVPENDADSLRLRIGPGPLRVSEIMAAPAPGECEWIELSATAPDGSLLTGYAIDVRGHRVELAPRAVDSSTRLSLVVEDSTLMRARFPALAPAQLWPYEGSWPRLRNGDRSGEVSDSIRLIGPDALLSDLALPGRLSRSGVSLERAGFDLPEGPAAWAPCGAPERASPGRTGPEGISSAPKEPLVASPRIVHPGFSTCAFEGRLGSRPGEVRLEISDLEGRAVRCLLRDLWAVGKVIATWDGRDDAGQVVAPGIYVAVLEVSRKGKGVERWRAAVAAAPGPAE